MNTQKGSKRILSVTVKRIADSDGDTSWLGEYSDEAEDFAIVAIGEHEGEFVDQLPCECEHKETEHNDGTDPNLAHDEGQCLALGCDCEEFDRVSVERGRDYRYFNSASIESSNTEADNRLYAQQDYKRMRGLDCNEWCYMGVSAAAAVQLSGLTQTIRSGGLWGIESDSGESYFTEVEGEQLSELREQLHAIGFSKRAITAAMRDVEHRDA